MYNRSRKELIIHRGNSWMRRVDGLHTAIVFHRRGTAESGHGGVSRYVVIVVVVVGRG